MEKKHIFTPTEKKLLMDLLKKYGSIIESKETDGASLRKKNETWERVTAEYNSSPVTTSQASSKQLRRLWVNLKQRQREALTKERQHRLATGGGPPITDAQIDPDVSVVAPALIVGIDSAIDSDSVQEMTVSSNNVKYPMPISQEAGNKQNVPENNQTCIPLMDDHDYIDIEIQPSSSTPPPFIPGATCTPLSTYQTLTHPPYTLQTTAPSSSAHLTSTFPPSTLQNTSPPPSTLQATNSARLTARSIRAIDKTNILEKEYKDRLLRAQEKHNLEMQILIEQLRECKAKAELAELILKYNQDQTTG